MTQQAYPGMTDCSTEFFLFEKELKVIQNGNVKSFTELPFNTIQILSEAIDADLTTKLALHDMHPISQTKRLEQFAICRFGGLDFQGDINNGELQDGEYWPCSKHGNCDHEGVLCKLPCVNGNRLTKKEVHLMQLTSTDKTNDVIAEEMNLCFGTFHQIKKFLYEKLCVQTKQEVSIIAKSINLI